MFLSLCLCLCLLYVSVCVSVCVRTSNMRTSACVCVCPCAYIQYEDVDGLVQCAYLLGAVPHALQGAEIEGYERVLSGGGKRGAGTLLVAAD